MCGEVYFLFSKRNQDKIFPDGEIVYFAFYYYSKKMAKSITVI